MQGYKQWELFMRSGIELHDILIIRAHCLHPNKLVEFVGLSINYNYKAISDMHDGEVLKCGRPKGRLGYS